MKKYCILSLVLLCFMATNVFAQSKNEGAIRNVLDKQSSAWNEGNIEAFMKGYWENDSLMFIGKKGLTYGWKNTLNNYKKNYPDAKAMGKLTFTLLVFKPLSDEYEEVIGKWHLKREDGDLEGHFTLLFRKIGNQWLIVMDHSS